MCSAYRIDEFPTNDPEQPEVVEWCEAILDCQLALLSQKFDQLSHKQVDDFVPDCEDIPF